MYILKPKKLDLQARIEKYKPDFKVNIDFLYFFISGIIVNTQYRLKEYKKKIDWNTFEDSLDIEKYFISRSSKINQQYCQDYKRQIQFLLEDFPSDGRILWGQTYIVGERSFGYQLPPYYFYEELELYKVTDKNLLNRIRKYQKPPRIDNQIKAKYNFLIKYFDKKRFTIVNKENAMTDLSTNFTESKNYQKYLSNATKLIQFLNGEFPLYNKKSTDGRVHTAITQFPKKIRKYLRYDNEILAETDLSSSIPFFLYFILNKVANGKVKHISEYINSKYLLNFYMLGKKAVTLCSKELALFGGLIMDNKLYEHLMYDFLDIHLFDTTLKEDEYLLKYFEKEFDRKFDGDLDDLKMFAKKRILSMLFARTDQYIHEQAIFQKYFPTIHLFLKNYKKSYVKELKGKGQYKKLSYLGFQVESYFMLHLIARGFNNIYKGKKIILTLHDCCIVKKEDITILHDYMKQIFIREMGFAPNLTIKNWENIIPYDCQEIMLETA